jgi:hypothetical protein
MLANFVNSLLDIVRQAVYWEVGRRKHDHEETIHEEAVLEKFGLNQEVEE